MSFHPEEHRGGKFDTLVACTVLLFLSNLISCFLEYYSYTTPCETVSQDWTIVFRCRLFRVYILDPNKKRQIPWSRCFEKVSV